MNESRFTSARPDCLHPEYWTSTDSESTENEVSEMIGGLVRGLQPDFSIETGSAYGNTTLQIGLALKANGHGRLVSLEIDTVMYHHAARKVGGLPVTVKEMSSLDYVPEEPIDFAFFDSQFNHRAQEFKNYRYRMHRNTIVAFHDTGEQYTFRNELADLEQRGMLKLIYLPTARGLAIGQVIVE